MLDGYGHGAVPFKWQPPSEHLVEDDTGGVNIAAGVDPISPCLFRRDIVNRAQCLLGQGLGSVFQAGDAEVGHLHTAVPQHHHILRLDVPVDDAAAVGMAQAPHDLGDEVQRLPPIQLAPLFHILLECNAVNELHDDILGVSPPGDIIHRDDVGMRELCDGLGLGVEAAPEVLILSKVRL